MINWKDRIKRYNEKRIAERWNKRIMRGYGSNFDNTFTIRDVPPSSGPDTDPNKPPDW